MTRTLSWHAIARVFGMAAAVGYVGGATVVAQSQRPDSKSDVRQTVIIGCLMRAAPSQGDSKVAALVITDFRGGPERTFRLAPDDSRLTAHIGHTVEIRGTIVSDGAVPPLPRRLDVESVLMLSTQCWPTQEPAGAKRP